MQFGGQDQPAYPALSALLGDDESKVGMILRVFHQSAWKDLERLERLASEGQWHRALNLANRIAIGCRQIGENEAADVFASHAAMAIESAHADGLAGAGTFAQLFQMARRVLIEVLDRVAAHVALAGADA